MGERLTSKNCIYDDAGFSIIEVLIGVFILAIVSAPILRSFMIGSITNSKAQEIQNATSLAESVMEEVKGNSIKNLCAATVSSPSVPIPKFADSSSTINFYSAGVQVSDETKFDEAKYEDRPLPPYMLKYTNVTSTLGRRYDAVVNITADEYNNAASGDASNINAVKLPKLYDVQKSKDHAVLSWEINKYDDIALSQLVEINSKKDADKVTVKSNIESNGYKTTTVKITDAVSPPDSTKHYYDITCDITYETGTSGDKKLEYNVYKGKNLEDIEVVPDKSDGGPHIYLFYAMSALKETEYFRTEKVDIQDASANGLHNIYIMLQDDANGKLEDLKYTSNDGTKSADLTLSVSNTSGSKTENINSTVLSSSPPADFQWDLGGGETLYTNFKESSGATGKLYKTQDKNRIYQVDVKIYKQGETDMTKDIAHLVSTMETGAEANK